MKENSRIILRIVVVLALVIAMGVRPFGPVKAASSTPVYVLGVSNPTDPLIIDLQSLTSSATILTSVTGLTTLSTSSILYIDGSWLATVSSLDPTVIPTIDQTVLAGLPAVVVRGHPSILVASISGLMKLQNPGLPLIAEGVHVIGTLADGTKQGTLLRVISGFDYSVAAEFQWANQQIAQAGVPTTFAPLATTDQSSKPTIITQASTGPPSQFNSGSSPLSYSIGAQNSTQSMSYFLKNTNVTNTSSSPNVSWVHTIDGHTAAGKLALQVIPGWTDRVVQTQPLNIQGNVAVTFAIFNTSQPTNTALTGVAFGIGGA